MAWNPTSAITTQTDLNTLEQKRNAYAAALVDLATAQTALNAKQAIVDAKKMELNTAQAALEADVATYHAD
jgi:hypothetical protein